MNYELRVPAEKIDAESFTVIAAQLRMLYGVPADVIPRSEFDLRVMVAAGIGSDYAFCRWLRGNGYEVVRPEFNSIPKAYYVIRRADVETIMYDNMSRSIMEDIDKAVLRKIKGKC